MKNLCSSTNSVFSLFRYSYLPLTAFAVGFSFCIGGPVHAQLTESPLLKLTPTQDHLDSTASRQAGFRFGKVALLDALPSYKGEELPALTHVFTFKNEKDVPVVIEDVESDCSCTRPDILDPTFQGLPYSVAPGAEIHIKVSLDPTLVAGGQVKRTVNLLSTKQTVPLATMTMEGFIDNGISAGNLTKSEPVVQLQAIPQGIKVTRQVFIRLDKRLPLYFAPGTRLRLVTTNPHITLEPKFNEAPKGMTLDEDILSFVDNKKPLAQDVTLRYQLTQDETTEPGKVEAKLVLAADKPATVAMLRHINIPFEGYVIRKKLATPASETQPQATTAP